MANPLILVVDDEPNIANLIADIVNGTDKYEAITANSAQEALNLLQKNKVMFGLGGNRVRFAFLDIKMPGMDGLQLLEKIRKDFGEEIGIAMLTAWEDAEKWDKATSGFVVDYIKKPFKAEELTGTLDKFFAGQEGKMVINTFERHIEKREEFKKKN